MIVKNMNLVYFTIRKYFPQYANDEDIKQIGMIGLIKAVDSYDTSISMFSTYATTVIVNEIRYHFRLNNKHIGVLSLNDKYDMGDCDYVEFGEVLVGDEDVNITSYCYEKFYEDLTEREKTILDLSLTCTQQQIADKLGLSQTRISRMKKEIRRKWREFNGEDFN